MYTMVTRVLCPFLCTALEQQLLIFLLSICWSSLNDTVEELESQVVCEPKWCNEHEDKGPSDWINVEKLIRVRVWVFDDRFQDHPVDNQEEGDGSNDSLVLQWEPCWSVQEELRGEEQNREQVNSQVQSSGQDDAFFFVIWEEKGWVNGSQRPVDGADERFKHQCCSIQAGCQLNSEEILTDFWNHDQIVWHYWQNRDDQCQICQELVVASLL